LTGDRQASAVHHGKPPEDRPAEREKKQQHDPLRDAKSRLRARGGELMQSGRAQEKLRDKTLPLIW